MGEAPYDETEIPHSRGIVERYVLHAGTAVQCSTMPLTASPSGLRLAACLRPLTSASSFSGSGREQLLGLRNHVACQLD